MEKRTAEYRTRNVQPEKDEGKRPCCSAYDYVTDQAHKEIIITDYLFAHPSFLEGMARCLDLGDTLTEYNQALTGEQADRLAMMADWRAVGEDFKAALGSFESYHQS